MSDFALLQGDCLEVLKSLPDSSIDSLVTDPPYGLSQEPNIAEVMQHWLNGDKYSHASKGFMGKSWDSFVPGPEYWREVYRVLKPGAHGLVFAGTRTVDLMGISLRFAGFEIRDTLQWIYGCYSEDTECFTRKGWVAYDRITKNTEVLQWDSSTGELSWTKPLNIIIASYSGPMVQLKNRHVDQLLTPNHRVYARIQPHSRNSRPKEFTVIEASELKPHWKKALPVSGKLVGSNLTRPLAYLLGWWMTDAWVHGDGKAVMFSQSKPATLLKLREALVAAGATFSEYTKAPKKETHNVEHTFYVTGELATYLLSEYPKRDFGHEILDWDEDSRSEFLRGLIDGDGSRRDTQHGVMFWSKRASRLETVQALGLSLGYRTLINYKNGSVHLNPKLTTEVSSKHGIGQVNYSGFVWCLQVPKGAFLVRRNGKPFISGNSGFPKSQSISLAIDKQAGPERKVIGKGVRPIKGTENHAGQKSYDRKDEFDTPAPATPEAKQWEGWGTQLKPANEPIILIRKPISENTIAANVLKHGTGGLNIDVCRISVSADDSNHRKPSTEYSGQIAIPDGTSKGRPVENLNSRGRFPANLLFSHNDDCVEVDDKTMCTEGCAVAALDEQTGNLSKQGSPKKKNTGDSSAFGGGETSTYYGDSGTGSRFFYCSKVSKKERNFGCAGLPEKESGVKNASGRGFSESDPYKKIVNSNNHPTVKPINLMSYLIKLITPPQGVVLDPFTGSGSTGVAATINDFNFIGVEQSEEYINIAQARIGYAAENKEEVLKMIDKKKSKQSEDDNE